MKLPISAMVVGYNEAHFLKQCLASISFCDEIIYTDLGSTDNSLEIASRFTDKICHRDRALVPSCEMVQAELVHNLKNDWVIFIDPDEEVDISLAREITEKFDAFKHDDQLGAVMVPWQFYFARHKLKGTTWGGINTKFFLVNRKGFLFKPIVHYGRSLAEGYAELEIPFDGKLNVLHHYWMNSYSIFIKKHFRYLKNEGKNEYKRGRRTSIKIILLSPFKEFYYSLITKKGYKDYFIGIFLSAFWAYYRTSVLIGIFRVQQNKNRIL